MKIDTLEQENQVRPLQTPLPLMTEVFSDHQFHTLAELSVLSILKAALLKVP